MTSQEIKSHSQKEIKISLSRLLKRQLKTSRRPSCVNTVGECSWEATKQMINTTFAILSHPHDQLAQIYLLHLFIPLFRIESFQLHWLTRQCGQAHKLSQSSIE